MFCYRKLAHNHLYDKWLCYRRLIRLFIQTWSNLDFDLCVCVWQGEVDAVFVNAILSGIQIRNMEVSYACVIVVQ